MALCSKLRYFEGSQKQGAITAQGILKQLATIYERLMERERL
jgi:hypothetical protein